MAKKLFYSDSEIEDGEVFGKEYFFPVYDGVLVEHAMDKSTERWCKALCLIISEGDCGCNCGLYSPLNGKFGKCLESTWCCSETGRTFNIVSGKLKLINK